MSSSSGVEPVKNIKQSVADISMDEEFRSSEEKQRARSLSALFGIIQGRHLVFANERMVEFSGYTLDEAYAMDIEDFLPPEFRDLVPERARRRQLGEEMPRSYDFPIITKNGEQRWLNFRADLTEYDGKPAIIATGFDITERKRAEEALLKGEEEFRSLAMNTKAICGIIQEGRSVYMNEYITKLTGYSVEEVLAMEFAQLVHPDYRDMVMDRSRRRQAGEDVPHRYEFALLAKNGDMKWIDFSGGLIAYRGKPAVIWTGVDHTEHKKMEEVIAERQKNLELVFNSGTRFLEMSKSAQIFKYLSEQLRQIAGNAVIMVGEYDAESRESVRSFVGPEEKVRKAEKILGKDPVSLTFTVAEKARKILAKDWYFDLVQGGFHELTFGRIPLSVCQTFERNLELGVIYRMAFVNGEELLGTAAVLTDLAEGLKNRSVMEMLMKQAGLALKRLRAEDGLRKADRDKNNFLAILAHELRNPLAPISASTDFLKIALADYIHDPEVIESLEVISRQAKNMKRLLDDLLDISRIIRGKIELQKERVALADIIHQAVRSTASLIKSAEQQLSVSAPVDLFVEGDPVRLEQIIVNFINNSAKFTSPGGNIRLELRCEGADAVIDIADTGIGIEREMLERIFDLFSQVDNQASRTKGGLGIGLTLVKNLVHMHGGTVQAQSPGLGKGSTFTVRLPLAPLEEASNATLGKTVPTLHEPLTAQRILVVDDNVDAAKSLVRLLSRLGQEAKFAASGHLALEMAKQWQPQLYFLDIGMPDMNGYELAREIRKSEPEDHRAVLVALTGYGQEEDMERAREAGFDHHIVKPAGIQDIKRALASA
jgi:PAS domain S-box-containing protein